MYYFVMGFILVKITTPTIEVARTITKHLLEKKYISSGNFFSIKSMSAWTGEIQEVDEAVAFLKTRQDNWIKVRDEIVNIHPYKVPCVIKIECQANDTYESWINQQTI